MLSALLDWPQGTFASVVDVLSPEKVNVTREVDGGLQTLQLRLPAVVTTDLRLNEPRFASLPNIMKAKKKPVAKLSLADVGLSDDVTKTRLTVTATEEPATRQAGIKVANVAELIEKLKNEAGVL
jgi:electron transfer flavoprotein beta subunit